MNKKNKNNIYKKALIFVLFVIVLIIIYSFVHRDKVKISNLNWRSSGSICEVNFSIENKLENKIAVLVNCQALQHTINQYEPQKYLGEKDIYIVLEPKQKKDMSDKFPINPFGVKVSTFDLKIRKIDIIN